MNELAEILVQRRKVTPAQVEDILQSQALYGGSFDTNLLELGLVAEQELQVFLELASRIVNRIDVRGDPAPEAVKLLGRRDAEKYRTVPFRLDKRVLDVVLNDPREVATIDEIAFRTGCRVVVNIATEMRVAFHLERAYGVGMPTRLRSLFAGNLWPKPELRSRRPAAATSPAAPGSAPVDPDGVHTGIDWTPPPARVDTTDLLPPPRPRPATIPPAAAAAPARRPTTVPPVAPAEPAPRRPATVPPEAPEPDAYSGRVWTGIESLDAAFAEVTEREDLPPRVFGFLANRLGRVALFTVNRDQLIGWDLRGSRLRRDAFAAIALPLGAPSVFAQVVEHGVPFMGRLPGNEVEDTLFVKLGGDWPEHVLLWPVRVKERTVVLLYAEAASAEALTGARELVVPVVDQLEKAFVRLILEKKKKGG